MTTEQAKKSFGHHTWKWLGSLVMEPKTDGDGDTHMAVSLSKMQKLLSLLMAIALFITMLVLWIVKPEMVNGVVTDPIPDSMLYTFYGLAGVASANQLASAIAARTGAKD